MTELESWGYHKFIWEEDRVYLHTVQRLGKSKVSYYYVDGIKGERVKGFNLITGEKFSQNYKTLFMQEFEKPDYKIMIEHLFRYNPKVL